MGYKKYGKRPCKGMTLANAYRKSNNIILQAVKDISSAITCRSLINLDFADVKTIMSGMGEAHIGCGTASGANRIQGGREDSNGLSSAKRRLN